VKNRKREICTSGSARDEDGNILIYSAKGQVYLHAYDSVGETRASIGR